MLKAQKALAEELVKLRKQAGLSQRDVSTKLGYSTPQFISNWERGVSEPPVSAALELALLYKVPVAHLKYLMINRAVEEVVDKIEKKFKELK